MSNSLILNKLFIDWSKISPDSYLRSIPALSGLDELPFEAPVTFFVGENGNRCVNEESQFIIVSHSPILLGFPEAQILSFDDGPIHPCHYEDTDSYQITSLYLNNREQLLSRLLM